MATPFGNRCGDCAKFPGNGVKCKDDTTEGRKTVYFLDYKCEEVKT